MAPSFTEKERAALYRVLGLSDADRIPTFRELFRAAPRSHREDAHEAVESLPRAVDRDAVRRILRDLSDKVLLDGCVRRNRFPRHSQRVIGSAVKVLEDVAAFGGDAIPRNLPGVLAALKHRLGLDGSKSKGGHPEMLSYRGALEKLKAAGVRRDLARTLARGVVTLPGPQLRRAVNQARLLGS